MGDCPSFAVDMDDGEKYECCSLTDASTASGASLDELSECSQQDGDRQVELEGGCHRDVPVLRFNAVRWEEAMAKAEQIAAVYRPVQPSALPPQPSRAAPAAVQPPLQPPARSFPNPGKPSDPEMHRQLIKLISPGPDAIPSCWQGGVCDHVVSSDSEEYKAVTDYFVQTVGRKDHRLMELTRLQNAGVYKRYLGKRWYDPSNETVMFHGCRSQSNEDSIRSIGFQIARCCSGGQNYGTWFAYNASYSDSGYAFDDHEGVRHLFICVVCYTEVVQDNSIMRVVGQDCAYPMWLLKYERPRPVLPPRSLPVSPLPVYRSLPVFTVRFKPTKRRKRKKHRVHGGCWDGLLANAVRNGR